ncbi:MAG: FAD-dependent oxidoreductase [Planctomycetaceae bacterium]|nr:FAD-dependent oxidoreductase [Planctomycetaceae bacterium]
MTTAALLHPQHDITVLEANDYIGGHTHTVAVDSAHGEVLVDTGFIVFNERTYPNFCRMLSQLGVPSEPTSMSFSVRCDRTGCEYNGTSLNGVFSQRRNLLRPSFLRMVADILRFNRQAVEEIESLDTETTVGEFLSRHRYSRTFAQHYLLPMGAAIWSCPTPTFRQFPIRFIIEFYKNHGLLQLKDRPVWRTISGGSKSYVEKLTSPFRSRIRLNCPVKRVWRLDDVVEIVTNLGTEAFDEVIFACHSDQAVRLLGDADQVEKSILSEFPYSSNRVVLHTDTSVLPRSRRAWASWNYHIPSTSTDRPTLTYWMNLLQGLDCKETYCVTLNEDDAIDPDKVLGRFNYSHPIFTTRREAAQKRHTEVIRHRRTSFCGAYWGNGFHEDGVNSALAVCRAFGVSSTDWSVVSRPSDSLRIDSRRRREMSHA